MMKIWVTVLLSCVSGAAVAQAQKPAPVEDLSSRESVLLQGQQRAGIAYRELQQAQHDAKFAEQDYLNYQDAHRAAQKRADELSRQLNAAKKTLDAARAKETAARQRYEKEVNAVGQLPQKSPAK
ncbi:MAG: hypothetical protein Q8K18_08615 [Burkholderiales bacterium]|nr:hypothetical protein [Burkholderiales bacterium]